MKSYIKNSFKKRRHKEKQIFLFSNIVMLVVVMALVWISYDPNAGTITFPPTLLADAASDVDNIDQSTLETNPTENTVAPTIPETTVPSTEVEESTKPTESTTEPEKEWPKYHTVVNGDTWYNISIQYFGTDTYADALAYTNNRNMTEYIVIGEILTIEEESYLIHIIEDIRNDNSTDQYYFFEAGPFGYKYGQRSNPAIDVTISKDCTGKNNTEDVDTSTFEYLGKHLITGYDPYCTHCCSGTGLMASGNYAVNGYSVASSYPLGTTLYIEGYGFYVVEDRGVEGKHIDIAAPSHEACYAITNESVAVYIVPNNN